jgi:hypothetical protein
MADGFASGSPQASKLPSGLPSAPVMVPRTLSRLWPPAVKRRQELTPTSTPLVALPGRQVP